MALLPVSDIKDNMPLGGADTVRTAFGDRMAAQTAQTIAALTGASSIDTEVALRAGDRTVVPTAKRQVVPANDVNLLIENGYTNGLSPEQVAEAVAEEQVKESDWYSVGDNFYLEQALALGDSTVSAGAARTLTNIAVAETIFRQELDKVQEETGIGGMVWDFIDRYLIRAVPIGGIEQLTNRNERRGRDMLAKAITMEPAEFEGYLRGYIEELRSEGVFTRDNLFALMDGLYELQTKGEDPNELMNRAFGAVDVAPVLALPKLLSALRTSTTLQRIASLKGPKVAADIAEAQMREPIVRPSTAADVAPSALDPAKAPSVKVPSTVLTERVADNRIVRGVRGYYERGFLGRTVSSPQISRIAEDIRTHMRKIANNPLVNVSAPVRLGDTGDYIYDVTLGTVRGGKPFVNERGAQRLVDKLKSDYPTAKTVPVDANDLDKGYYVNVTERLDLAKGVDTIDMKPAFGPIRQIIARTIGSRAQTESEELQTLAGLAEAGASSIGRLVKDQVKRLNKLPTRSKRALSRLYSEIRDGEDAFIRDILTEDELSERFLRNEGREPTPQEIDAYYTMVEINDASYMLKAHRMLQRYVEKGFYALKHDGQRILARRSESVPADELVLDLQTGATILGRQLSDKQAVWVVDGEFDGFRYVTKAPEVDIVQHSDVLGYNSGGRRINPDANYFVTVGPADNPRAFLTTFTAGQADDALNSIRAINEAIQQAGGAEALRGSRVLDELVQQNNRWNPDIQTLDDYLAWASEKDIDIAGDFNLKVRDDQIQDGEVISGLAETWGEHFTHKNKRYDDTLMEYGGKEARQRDPLTAMFEDFSSSVHQYAHNHYTLEAAYGWLDAATRRGSGWDVPAGTSPLARIQGARLSGTKNLGAGELAAQRQIIMNRLSVQGEFGQRMNILGQKIKEFVHDKTGAKISGDPRDVESALLGLGHQSAFGFFNPAQFFVQGFHAAVVTAISPVQGSRGYAMAIPMMALLQADDLAVQQAGLRRLSKFFGITEEDATELMEYIRVSGRDIVDATVMERGTPQSWGVSGWKGESALPSSMAQVKESATRMGKAGLDTGLMFFNGGERLGRLTAIATAFLEFKAANKGVSALSEIGFRTISRREQALTFRMTNTNRAAFQTGVMKLPTQWFSYTFRAMESVFLGRDFTLAERARIAMVLGPMFGLSGFGAERFADWLGEKIGAEPAGDAYDMIKYGPTDVLFQWASGQELALGERLAPLTLLVDTYNDIIMGDKTPVQVALGPSGDILGGFMTQAYNAMADLVNGRSYSMTEDTMRTVRQISGVDNQFKAWGVVRNGTYRSRTGTTLPFEMDFTDALSLALGFSPREVSEWYSTRRWSYRDSRELRSFAKSIETDWSRAVELVQEGQEDRGFALMRELHLRIIHSGFSLSEQRTIRRSLKERAHIDIHKLIMEQYRKENPYRAAVIERTFRGEQ